MELTCEVKTYDWGKLGFQSKVAKLCQVSKPQLEVDEYTPYAELWMGSHPSGPSQEKGTERLLTSIIEKNPHLLGEPIRQNFGDRELPFLFKVLSIDKALSIQAHPSKTHAEELNRKYPDIYKDDNHKPELAIALTPFQALCGFRHISEIKSFMKEVRELRAVVGPELAEKFIFNNKGCDKELLKMCFKSMMNCGADVIAVQLKQLIAKFGLMDEEARELQLAPLIQRLYDQFPDDVGCFGVFFFNVINLEPYEALYLGPNLPHAYLFGDCIECMACSDNVVRVGLTPKFKDVETLCEMLDYDSKSLNDILLTPLQEDECCTVFKPPVLDFAVAKYDIPSGSFYKIKPRNSATIVLVVEGYGNCDSLTLKSGTVLFLPANDALRINCVNNMLIFQASMNV